MLFLFIFYILLYTARCIIIKRNYQVRGQSYGIRIPVRSGIEKNWGRGTYISKKGISKSFIKDKATEEDLKELVNLIKLRWEYLAKAEGSKLKIKNSPELLKKVLPDVNSDYVIDLKSNLSREAMYQDLWGELKKIIGGPLLAIDSSDKVIYFDKFM